MLGKPLVQTAKGSADYSTVTEVVGEQISPESAAMMRHRYSFVSMRAEGLDVLEVSCGAGQGLGCIASRAHLVVGVDITHPLLAIARSHYRSRIPLVRGDAQALPFATGTYDVVAIHEAIYYYPDADRALTEAHRVLRPGGRLFITTINPDWRDFNPSPFSTSHLDATALAEALARHFELVEMFGAFPVVVGGVGQRALSALKRLAVAWRLIPKTMKGKRLLKRLVFGPLVTVPPEFEPSQEPPIVSPQSSASLRRGLFKVIYAIAHRA